VADSTSIERLARVPETARRIHLIGVGGAAMAALAGMLAAKGYVVTGSDRELYEPTASLLKQSRIEVKTGFGPQNLKPVPDLAIVGNVITRDNPEAEALLKTSIPYLSMPEALWHFFLQHKRVLMVTGTHGKTTSTSMMAAVLNTAGRDPSMMVGGVAKDFNSNYRLGNGGDFVIEGDEYDTAFFDKGPKFLHYRANASIITAVEFDHADIFENLGAVQTSFKRLINLIPRNGQLLANGDDANLAPLLNITHCPVKRFGLGEHNAIKAFNLRYGPTATEFEIPSFKFHLNMVGELNVRNALAVVACAKHCGLSNKQIQAGFDSFKGVKRRMEIRGVAGGVTVIDDFGHHPTAIRETLSALRLKYGQQRIWAVFEPRTNTTRRNVFQTELAEAFRDADAVVLSQIARLELLKPEERLDPQKLLQDLEANGKPAAYLPDADSIVAHLKTKAAGGDVICIFSNGGFGGIHEKLLATLGARK